MASVRKASVIAATAVRREGVEDDAGTVQEQAATGDGEGARRRTIGEGEAPTHRVGGLRIAGQRRMFRTPDRIGGGNIQSTGAAGTL
jgi:hypothetical protein